METTDNFEFYESIKAPQYYDFEAGSEDADLEDFFLRFHEFDLNQVPGRNPTLANELEDAIVPEQPVANAPGEIQQDKESDKPSLRASAEYNPASRKVTRDLPPVTGQKARISKSVRQPSLEHQDTYENAPSGRHLPSTAMSISKNLFQSISTAARVTTAVRGDNARAAVNKARPSQTKEVSNQVRSSGTLPRAPFSAPGPPPSLGSKTKERSVAVPSRVPPVPGKYLKPSAVERKQEEASASLPGHQVGGARGRTIHQAIAPPNKSKTARSKSCERAGTGNLISSGSQRRSVSVPSKRPSQDRPQAHRVSAASHGSSPKRNSLGRAARVVRRGPEQEPLRVTVPNLSFGKVPKEGSSLAAPKWPWHSVSRYADAVNPVKRSASASRVRPSQVSREPVRRQVPAAAPAGVQRQPQQQNAVRVPDHTSFRSSFSSSTCSYRSLDMAAQERLEAEMERKRKVDLYRAQRARAVRSNVKATVPMGFNLNIDKRAEERSSFDFRLAESRRLREEAERERERMRQEQEALEIKRMRRVEMVPVAKKMPYFEKIKPWKPLRSTKAPTRPITPKLGRDRDLLSSFKAPSSKNYTGHWA